MDILDKFFKKFSYKFPKGYPDINDAQDMLMLETLLEKLGVPLEENRQINSATKKAIAYFLSKIDPSLGFKSQSDTSRLGNPNKIDPEKVQQLFQNILGVKDLTIHSPKSGPNPSSKFDMYEFTTNDFGVVRIILSGGGNKGERYERNFAKSAQELAGQPNNVLPPYLQTLYSKLGIDNTKLSSNDISFAGATDTKRNLNPEGPQEIGETISDLTIIYNNKPYFISIKNRDGSGLYSGKNIPWIYKKDETVIYDPSKKTGSSDTNIIFDMLNIDSEKIAQGLNNYVSKEGDIDTYSSLDINENTFRKLLASSFGYGYYYVKETSKDQVKVVPILTADDALKAVGKFSKVEIKYPGPNTKQVTINVFTKSETFGDSKYQIGIRNTSGKLLPLSLRISKVL